MQAPSGRSHATRQARYLRVVARTAFASGICEPGHPFGIGILLELDRSHLVLTVRFSRAAVQIMRLGCGTLRLVNSLEQSKAARALLDQSPLALMVDC
jgi:hypothetical protein